MIMNKELEEISTDDLLKTLNMIELKIELAIYEYDEYRKELVNRFPFIENYKEFKCKYNKDEKISNL